MSRMKNSTKAVVFIFFFALASAACGSGESTVASNDGTDENSPSDTEAEAETEATAEEGPAEGFNRITFNFAPSEVIDDVYQGDLSTFEVRSSGAVETVVVGFLDETGTIDIPSEIVQDPIEVQALWPDDELCLWIGLHTPSTADSVMTIDVELEAICQ